MASNPGRTRPYRKASEYVVQAQRNPISNDPRSQIELENEVLRQKVHVLTRKLEHAEIEFQQSRDYLETQLDLSHEKLDIISQNYNKLQQSFTQLSSATKEIKEANMQISRLDAERSSLMTDVCNLSAKLDETKNALHKTQEENERLRKDCNLAVQLLKCNQSSYQLQRPEQLPKELRERMNKDMLTLQSYNEYINPYGESDSESDDNLEASYSARRPSLSKSAGGVSVDLIANVLQKSENVHLNLEDTDYIKDPQLTSLYKSRYKEKVLIKPSYDQDGAVSSASKKPIVQQPYAQPVDDPASPWELQRCVPPQSAPCVADLESETPAGAYGAYSVGPQRSQSRLSRNELYNDRPRREAAQVESVLKRDKGSEEWNLREDERGGGYGLGRYDAASSSKSNSARGSPLKVRSGEKSSQDEKTSLLVTAGGESESDDSADDVMTSNVRHLLNSKDGADDEELEWDPTLHAADAATRELDDDGDDAREQLPPAADLLLSYSDVPAQASEKPCYDALLRELVVGGEVLLPSSPQHEATLNDDSLLASPPPPPPQQFAADALLPEELEAVCSGEVESELRSDSEERATYASEELELVGLNDATDGGCKRSGSFDRAQQFGNVLD